MLKVVTKMSHSWWWDSHISPKNSNWLAENREEMDKLVKDMLKLTDEEGDSFATKAEMYYNRRPELVSHVEKSYRMYRALAERYDNVTRELRANIESRHHHHHHHHDLRLSSVGLGSEDQSFGSPEGSEKNTPPYQKLLKPHPSPRAAGFDVFLGSGGSDLSPFSSSDSDFEAEEIKTENRVDADSDARQWQKIIDLEVELEILRATHGTTLELWKADVSVRDELNVKLMASIENLSNSKSDLESLVSEQEYEKSELNKNIDGLQLNLRMLESEKDELCVKIHALTEDVVSRDNMISNMNGNLQQLHLDHGNLMKIAEKVQIINMDLQRKVNELEALSEKDELCAKIHALTEDVVSRDNLISNMNGNLQQLHLDNGNLMKTAEKAQIINMDLQRKVNELEALAEQHRITIYDTAEGKREAIRQLCFSIDHYRARYHALRQVLKS